MDSYDSDSSGFDENEQEDYTETGVLLGYASEEPTDDSISHLGGLPTWLDPSTPPPGNFAKCKTCSNPMPLLLQLNAGLPEYFPDDERWLYIFGCTKRTCNRKQGNMRAFRGVKKHKTVNSNEKEANDRKRSEAKDSPENTASEEQQKPKRNIGADLFGVAPPSQSSGNANPFATTSSSSSSAQPNSNPFAPLPSPSTLSAIPPQKPDAANSSKEKTLSESFADKVRVSSPPPSSKKPTPPTGPPEPWPAQSSFPQPYPQYHLDADYETLSRPPTPTIPSSVQIEPVEVESGSSAGNNTKDEKDVFESTLDKSFLRFSMRVAHNPEQILRYEFRGTPLLYSTTDEVGKLFTSELESKNSNTKVSTSMTAGGNRGNRIPRCESCGSERVFELQLAPHAITMLEEGREGLGLGPKDDPGMEWGTAIVGVCGADCGLEKEGAAGWREEWIGVQFEERMK